ncbi:unnamed protein product [Ambrosiozyma monospora]|uniref:Unnamed protein product n=1 Tax=Ambrosiozyma monospora TaxID=43982 RepID=A0ACB5STY7_AMBMO|nr:unnamed protein product [Ambrosiozyma monospora]
MVVSLSKLTKRELQDLADEMEIDVSGFSLKKDYYLGVKEYLNVHKNEFSPGHKYYDWAHSFRNVASSSPTKRQIDYSIAVNTSDDESSDDDEEIKVEKSEEPEIVPEVKQEEESDDSDEEESDSDADTGDEEVQLKEEENDEEEEAEEEANEQDEEAEEDDNDDDEEDAEDEEEDEITVFLEENRTSGPAIATVLAKFGKILKRSQPKSEKLDKAENYILERNYRAREFLSDPYHINDWLYILETLVLLWSFTTFINVEYYVPESLQEHIPEFLLSQRAFDYHSFNFESVSTVALWAFSTYLIPTIFSYYMNFTYDFEYDAFTFALIKFVVSLIVFKTVKEPYALAEDGCCLVEYAKYIVINGAISLEETFGNWVVIGSLVTSVIALYANLTFV